MRITMYHISSVSYIIICNVIRYDSDRYVHRLAETFYSTLQIHSYFRTVDLQKPKMQASDAGFCSQAALRAAEAAILEAVEVGITQIDTTFHTFSYHKIYQTQVIWVDSRFLSGFCRGCFEASEVHPLKGGREGCVCCSLTHVTLFYVYDIYRS